MTTRTFIAVSIGVVARVVRIGNGEEVQSAGFAPIEVLLDQMGYPTSAFIDVFQIADEELRFSIETLVAR